MNKLIKLLLTTLCAITVTILLTTAATANRSVEVRGGPRVQAEGQLTFLGTEGNRALEITCDITLLRTVAAVVPKIRGTLFGKVTGIAIDRGEISRTVHCRHGSFIREVHDITPLIGLERECRHTETGTGILRWDCSGAPATLWKLIYDSFQGTLPRITGVNIHIQGYQTNARLLEPFGATVECLYEGSAFGLITVNADGTVTSARAVRELTGLIRTRGSGLCPARASFEGQFTVRPTLTIRLL